MSRCGGWGEEGVDFEKEKKMCHVLVAEKRWCMKSVCVCVCVCACACVCVYITIKALH